jgi:hypothetical protein
VEPYTGVSVALVLFTMKSPADSASGPSVCQKLDLVSCSRFIGQNCKKVKVSYLQSKTSVLMPWSGPRKLCRALCMCVRASSYYNHGSNFQFAHDIDHNSASGLLRRPAKNKSIIVKQH